MTSPVPPSKEREAAYKTLQESANKIHEVIVTSYLKETLTPWDLLTYSVNTFAQSAELFPYAVPTIKQLMRDIITLSMDTPTVNEIEERVKEVNKKSGLVGLNGEPL